MCFWWIRTYLRCNDAEEDREHAQEEWIRAKPKTSHEIDNEKEERRQDKVEREITRGPSQEIRT